MLKAAVIGIGHVGFHHARILASHPKAKLAAIVDTDTSKASLAQQFNTLFYQNFQEIPEDINAISIASPTSTHAFIAKYFLEQGKHLFIEKPLADDLESATWLVNYADQNNLIMHVGLIEKFNPAFINFKKYFARPVFIESHRIHPFIQRCLDVDVVLDLMIHDLDLLTTLFEEKLNNNHQYLNTIISEIEAVGAPVVTDKTDIAHARLKFSPDCICNLNVSRVSRKSIRKMRIFQSDGYYSLDFSDQSLTISKPEITTHPDKPQIHISTIGDDKIELLPIELNSFIDSVLNNIKEVPNSGRSALPSLILAFEIKKIIERPVQ